MHLHAPANTSQSDAEEAGDWSIVAQQPSARQASLASLPTTHDRLLDRTAGLPAAHASLLTLMPTLVVVVVVVLVHACDQPRALRHALGGVTCFHMQMQLVRNVTVADFHARIERSDQSALRYSAARVSDRSPFGAGGDTPRCVPDESREEG